MRKRTALALPVMIALAACAQFPELEEVVSESARNAPYAKLGPIEDLQATAPEATITEATGDAIEARASRLKARASALDSDVIGEASQSRLEKATE